MRSPVSPRVVLAGLVLGALLLAIVAPFRAVNVVDNRTYFEMVAGVRDHHLPYTLNTWSEVLPEAAPSFNVARDGRLWGAYAPLHAYVAAPALAWGGLSGIHKLNFALLAILAVLVYASARRASGDARAGAFAAAVVLLGTPAWAAGFETVALPLALVLSTGALLAALRSLDGRGALFFCALAGLLAAAATSTHLMEFGIGAAMLVATSVARRSRAAVGTLVWARYALPRAAAGFGAFALGLVPMSLLNHVRFGTYNPLSYGPCKWQLCGYMLGEGALTARSLASFAAPVTLFAVVLFGALFAVRRSRAAIGAVLALSVLVLALLPSLRGTSLAMLRMVIGYFVDLTWMDLSPFERAGDGVGWLRGGRVVKALLQSSPCLVAALVVRPSLRGSGARALVLWAPALALAGELALLARYPGAGGFGWPYLFCRYGIYGVPFLAVLAARGVRRVRLGPAHAGVVAAVALLGFAVLVTVRHDFGFEIRVFLLYATLALAALLLAALVLARRAPFARRASPLVLALTVACSLAVTLGVDTARTVSDARALDRRLDRFAALVPQRFALAGWGPDTDALLALRAERDVHYVDLVETTNWDGFRQIMDQWADDGRPIYGVFPVDATPAFRWPYADWDVPAELLDAQEGFWRIGPPRRRVAPPKGLAAPAPPPPPPAPPPPKDDDDLRLE